MRVLNALSDSDRSDEHLAALELHRALTVGGLDVRTVALGPGRVGGLETAVPVIAHSPGSLAAHTELRREARWATVVLAHGDTAAKVARRSVRRAPVVAVGSTTPPIGIDTESIDASPRRRAVARDEFGIGDHTLAVVLLLTPRPAADATQLRLALGEALGVAMLLPGGADDELVWSAADAALDLSRSSDGQMSHRVLRAMASRVAVAVPQAGDGEEGRGASPIIEGCSLEQIRSSVGLLDDPVSRAARAAAARDQVEREWSWNRHLEPWLQMLGSASEPVPGDAGRP